MGSEMCIRDRNYKLPKELHEKASELTYEQCMELVKAAPTKPKRTTKASAASKAKK